MSRKAKLPISLSKGVEARKEGGTITVKGPKGTLYQEIKNGVDIQVQEGKIVVAPDKGSSSFRGLYWAILNNMVEGVAKGFEKRLEMIGVGFRAIVQGNQLNLQIGTSHPVMLDIPQGIKVSVEKNTLIIVEGIDKQKLGQFCADIRSQKRPEPYKGKGIRHVDEYVRRKQGKSGKK